ncbi:transposable element Tc1 transposase [Trichonephila clavipes]|nr:transposable element Tc1 transposase [Trichonephila clavipes]
MSSRPSTRNYGLGTISRTLLVVIRGTLTAQWYVEDILRTVLLQFLLQYPILIFQQDNARTHTARVALNCFTACQTLPWPARTPNLSPTEHVWNMMGRRVLLPGNVNDLALQLDQIWPAILLETIRNGSDFESYPLTLTKAVLSSTNFLSDESRTSGLIQTSMVMIFQVTALAERSCSRARVQKCRVSGSNSETNKDLSGRSTCVRTQSPQMGYC